MCDGNLNYVNKDEKARGHDIKVYTMLYNEYLERYDLTEEYKKYQVAQEKYIKISRIFVESGDEAVLNDLHIIDAELERLDPSKVKGMSIDSCLIYLSKWMGSQPINSKSITVVQFREMMAEYGRAN